MPGYPTDQDAPIRASDYEGRPLRQIEFDDSSITIGQFKATDYFGDGSFYLLDSPGVSHPNLYFALLRGLIVTDHTLPYTACRRSYVRSLPHYYFTRYLYLSWGRLCASRLRMATHAVPAIAGGDQAIPIACVAPWCMSGFALRSNPPLPP